MISGKCNIVMDGQWGSTGKGKLVGYLALRNEIAVATCDFMTNAGHTFVYDNGDSLITHQLPISLVNLDCMLAINPGAAVTLDRLFKEIEENDINPKRLMIHPNVCIITEEDKEHERKVLKRISSTLQGCGGSLARKVMRVAKLAKDEPKLKEFIGDTSVATLATLRAGGTVMVEGAQGFDLSLNHGFKYPYCTSRDITPMSIMNNAGIPFPYLGDVYGSLRTFPIRVGNTYDEHGNETGNSGPIYDDQVELSWKEITKQSGSPIPLQEMTTVTKKIRRIFSFSDRQLYRFIDVCAPTKLFMNFINYVNTEDSGKQNWQDLSYQGLQWLVKINDKIRKKYSEFDVPLPMINYIGTGAKNSDMVEY